MCARCFSSRRTSPFSAIICSIFSTVVYCVGLRAQTHSCTCRTVAGPRLQSTVRISNSASVGRGSISAIYEELTTKTFVCQEELSGIRLRLVHPSATRTGKLKHAPPNAAQPPGNGQTPDPSFARMDKPEAYPTACYNSICMFRKVLIANRGAIAVD